MSTGRTAPMGDRLKGKVAVVTGQMLAVDGGMVRH